MNHTQKNPSMPLVKHQRIVKRKRMYSTLQVYREGFKSIPIYPSEIGGYSMKPLLALLQRKGKTRQTCDRPASCELNLFI